MVGGVMVETQINPKWRWGQADQVLTGAGNQVTLKEVDITDLVSKAMYYDEIISGLHTALVDSPYFARIMIGQCSPMQWVVIVDAKRRYFGNPLEAVLAFIEEIVKVSNDG
ncbi:MAG: hypothetical protein ACYTEQ_06570 [Planctomycetota bacterium]